MLKINIFPPEMNPEVVAWRGQSSRQRANKTDALNISVRVSGLTP